MGVDGPRDVGDDASMACPFCVSQTRPPSLTKRRMSCDQKSRVVRRRGASFSSSPFDAAIPTLAATVEPVTFIPVRFLSAQPCRNPRCKNRPQISRLCETS